MDLSPLMHLLRAQHGVVDRHDLSRADVTRAVLRRLVAQGVLQPAGGSVYVLSAAPRTHHQRVMIAVAQARQRASDRSLVATARGSARHLWGLDDGRRPPATVQLVVPHGRTPTGQRPGVRIHRSRTLCAEQVTTIDGLPVTTPERTIVDSAINLAVPALREVVARGLRADVVRLDALSDQLRAAGRIHGAQRLRAAMLDVAPDEGLAQSRAEAIGFDHLQRAGFEVVRQHPVVAGGQRYRLDLAIVALALAIEVDGWWWHSTPRQVADDRRRQNAIQLAGWQVLRFPAVQVVRDPDHLVATVRTAAATRVARRSATSP